MARFKIVYDSGLVEEVTQTDCDTVEDFINTKFGSAGLTEGTTVTREGDDPEYGAELSGDAAEGDVTETNAGDPPDGDDQEAADELASEQSSGEHD